MMPELEHKKEKQVNFRIKENFLEQIDGYWPETGRFSSRSEFIIFLLQDELRNQRLLTQKSSYDEDLAKLYDSIVAGQEEKERFREEVTQAFGEIKVLKERVAEIQNILKIKKELGETLEEHSP